MEYKEQVRGLVEQLGSAQFYCRVSATERLMFAKRILRRSRSRAGEALAELATDPDYDKHHLAVKALGLLATPQSEPVLVKAARDPDPETRIESVIALGRINQSSSFIQALTGCVLDEDPKVRFISLMTIGKIMEETPEEALTDDHKRILTAVLKVIPNFYDMLEEYYPFCEVVETHQFDDLRIKREIARKLAPFNLLWRFDELQNAYDQFENKYWQSWRYYHDWSFHPLAKLTAALGKFPLFQGIANLSGLTVMANLHPDWFLNFPDPRRLDAFRQNLAAAQILPPAGGKIAYIGEGYQSILNPTITADEQAMTVTNIRRLLNPGSGYIHQMSVLGRLPDSFKFVALALILNSPYPYNWQEPSLETVWGNGTPMIHDGVWFTKKQINPNWDTVDGRTDFLQRWVLVHQPNLEELEQLSVSEMVNLSDDIRIKAISEQQERTRLLQELRFFQASGLGYHVLAGTVPEKVPASVCYQVAKTTMWFEREMGQLLAECGASEAATVSWFLGQPRNLAGWEKYGLRHEADWFPIQQALIHLEEVRQRDSRLSSRVSKLITQTTEEIYQDIGLNPALL